MEVLSQAADLQQELEHHGGFVLTAAQLNRVEEFPAESRRQETFVSEMLTSGNGDLSVEEIYTAYCDFCAGKGWTADSPQSFSTELLILMKQQHGTQGRNDILRNAKSVRGFKGVVFKAQTK